MLGRLLQSHVLDQVFEAQTVLLVRLGLFDLLVDYFLPGHVLGVGHELMLQHRRDGAKEVRVEFSRVEALGLHIDGHRSQLGHLRLARSCLLDPLWDVDLRHRNRLIWLGKRWGDHGLGLRLHSTLLFFGYHAWCLSQWQHIVPFKGG